MFIQMNEETTLIINYKENLIEWIKVKFIFSKVISSALANMEYLIPA